MFDKLLFPIDNSRETSHALPLVADIAQRYKSQVYLLSVLDSTDLSPEQAEQARQSIHNLLKQAEAGLQQIGIQNVKSEYREGKVPFVICDVADELEISLIVMGSRGISLSAEGQNNSVSHRVIDLSPCPVLVVP
ncbi:universal stress protein [Synechococcus sp. 63AY4M2]|jgi:nucleotide-binding universal stress UspA family protein|uniref:universal stress protein n=1 Tax=unclassified Synechococcus TaxID=2626047 RepID=UPI000C182847|nr:MULTISPECIES: universal stress protein [unclassified Synechococcus]PIK84607.1 universal stress protein [Synechococcus sp. 65AY6A5]PIK86505.1 universal stress protein [Synechococcus sp. 63AY4M2]PIK95571.1 universal stress protein [Synechococcus sp. 60AY4M2]PIK97815.1 universal stress protein [Synechococcus sp. 63AY4M1]PIL01463.1 universal stress protein [Synechococcus sp. 65AY640]